MENIFTVNIKSILQKNFGKSANDIFEKSLLIQYINEKTHSANRGSKSRASFGVLYSMYTLIEDYIAHSFHQKGNYTSYEGAMFSSLLKRAKELPFGEKQQNHYFNNRTNSEFRKFFPTADIDRIIIHKQAESRYWINENLLIMKIGSRKFNISKSVIEIIDEYVRTKQDAFQRFIKASEQLQRLDASQYEQVEEFIEGLLAPNVDARLFEIVSYSILKFYYHDQTIIWGFEMNNLNTENLKLYKTGRTNANDGGIDFVMKPLGRFFQVTETLDFKKYFLDIDKIQKYPISFVIKSNDTTQYLLDKIRNNANKAYSIKAIVKKYMDCIEEVINIPTLNKRFKESVKQKQGNLKSILDEIVLQSKTEFNYKD